MTAAMILRMVMTLREELRCKRYAENIPRLFSFPNQSKTTDVFASGGCSRGILTNTDIIEPHANTAPPVTGDGMQLEILRGAVCSRD